MQIKDADVFGKIDELSAHFLGNIYNRFLRKVLMTASLSNSDWSLIEKITERAQEFRYQGFFYAEMYDMILALSKFVYVVRQEIQPNLRRLLDQIGSDTAIRRGAGGMDNSRVFMDLAVNNFNSNMNILSDQIYNIYNTVVNCDKKDNGEGTEEYRKNPELQEIGRLLVQG